MLARHLRKHLIWMIPSYIFIALLANHFLILPQNKMIEQFKQEKEKVEYDYMSITTADFINSLDKVIKESNIQIENFSWVDSKDIDPTLNFYNYIYTKAKEANLDLVKISILDYYFEKKDPKAKQYYVWNVQFTGNFSNVLSMINIVENNQKFVRIEEIKITAGIEQDESATYNFIFLAIKRNALQ